MTARTALYNPKGMPRFVVSKAGVTFQLVAIANNGQDVIVRHHTNRQTTLLPIASIEETRY